MFVTKSFGAIESMVDFMQKMCKETATGTYIYQAGEWKEAPQPVVEESPVSITVNGNIWLTFMCTPADLEALAVGFLYNEGVIKGRDQVASLRVCPNHTNVDIWLTHQAIRPLHWRRTSGCTGGVTSLELSKNRPELSDGVLLTPAQISDLIRQLGSVQNLYRQSGGVHTSALSDGKKLLVVSEDIGRHNTLDKIAGICLLNDLNPPQRVLLTTGRISSEMIQKAGQIGASVVISLTSASSLSVLLAREWGQTLIGYARRDRFVVYTHAERILTSALKITSEINGV